MLSRRDSDVADAGDRRFAPRVCTELDATVRAPARARALAADLLQQRHIDGIGDELALVVSELVTNAVRHAEPPLRLELQADDHRVTVAVADGSTGHPRPREAADDAEGGRGLPMIELLAAETGVRPHPPGKTVWAALPID